MVNKKNIIVAKNAPDRGKYTLENMGYSIVESAFLKNVQAPLAYHPDMQIVKCGECFICAPECYDYYKNILSDRLICGQTSPMYDYPGDIAYNIAVTGKYAVHNFAYTDPTFLKNSQYKHISVKQGYSKCSVCVINENAIITSDIKIAEKARENGLDALFYDNTQIILKKLSKGFVGGISGLIDKNTLAINGNIEKLDNSERLLYFCQMHQISILSLYDGIPEDIGSILPIKQL